MDEGQRSFLVGTAGLDAAVVAAVILAVVRRPAGPRALSSSGVPGWFVATIAAQFLRFSEEYIMGFQIRLPELLGLPAWPSGLFVDVNLGILSLCLFSVPLVRRDLRIALFPAWLVALTATAGIFVHPILSLVHGGYFPGLWSAPIAGACGLLLGWRLLRATTSCIHGKRHTQS